MHERLQDGVHHLAGSVVPELQKALRMLLFYHINRDEAPAGGQSVDHSEEEMYADA